MKRKDKISSLPILIIFIMVFVPIFTMVYLQNRDLSDDIVADPPVVDNYDNTMPVISENNMIINPYYDGTVKIGKKYYDYKGEEQNQQESIIVSEDTYYQNTGIDFVSDAVFDVVAIKEGTVISVKEDDNTGKVVEIKHNDELVSIYQSLSEVSVKKDDVITQGQLIGKSGTNTLDKEIGNHLHLEIYKNGNPVNPENYLNKEYKREN